jgi:hypothetical protein
VAIAAARLGARRDPKIDAKWLLSRPCDEWPKSP